MTTYRLWPSTNGPSSVASDGNTTDLGLQVQVTAPCQINGYYFWLGTGGDTTGTHYAFRLYSTTNATSGTLISGSTVTSSGTWTTGAWNYTQLTVPVVLVSGTTYVVTSTYSGAANHYCSTASYWASNIANGPLTAPSAANAIAGAQQVFNEPSTGGMPVSVSSQANYWIDLQIADILGGMILPQLGGKNYRRRFRRKQRLSSVLAPQQVTIQGVTATATVYAQATSSLFGSSRPGLAQPGAMTPGGVSTTLGISPSVSISSGNISITGVAGSVSVSAPNGVVVFPATITGAAASVAVSAVSGTVVYPATIAGASAAISVTAVTGSVPATLNGVPASISVSAPAGSVTITGGNVSISGVTATATVTAQPGSIPNSATGTSASSSVAAVPGSMPVAIQGASAGVTASATAGSVPASIVGASAAVSVVAVPGVIPNTIVGVPASIAVTAVTGTVTAGSNTSVNGVVATVSVTAAAGTAQSGPVNGAAASVTVIAINGTFRYSATVSGIPAYVAVSATSGLVFAGTAASIDAQALGGTAVNTSAYTGIVTQQSRLSGETGEQNMATMQNLVALQNNDVPFALNLMEFGNPLNLTGMTLKLYVKASETTPDASATTYTVGSGLTITATLGGAVTWVLPHTATTIPGQSWWRIDVTDVSGKNGTSMYGNLYIVAV